LRAVHIPSHLNQCHCAVFCVLNKQIIKILGFFMHNFSWPILPETNFLLGIQNSTLSEPRGTRLRTTALAYLGDVFTRMYDLSLPL